MNDPLEPPAPRRRGGTCGCAAAAAFLVLVGLPVLMLFAFGNAPCPDGPCNPNGARNLRIAFWTVLATALAVWLGVRALVNWSDRRNDGRLPRWSLVAAGLLVLAALALFKLATG